ncbi:hypothetical protein GGI23_000435 [Coemansia sp. RSA 2559]|nr:hypothetical protein GGI23_000435 [Coemansia sp. RSA 2559]
MSFLLQIQRLAEPPSPQQQQPQKQQLPRKQANSGAAAEHKEQPLCGLGYAYAACPMCSKKVLYTQVQQWECRACKSKVDSVRWTYRLGVYLLPSMAVASSAVASSVLGSVADAWFGCSASQWVDMVERDVSLVMHVANTLEPSGLGFCSAAKMASDVAALVDGVSGICGSYALFDFKPPGLQAQRRSARPLLNPTISRILSVEPTWHLSISELWKYVVFETLCAMRRRYCKSSEYCGNPCVVELESALRELRSSDAVLDVACALSTPPSLTALSCTSISREANHLDSVTDSKRILDFLSPPVPCCTWENVQVSLTPGLKHPANAEEPDEMDALLDQCSQLFQSFTATNRQIIEDDTAMSMQLFEESIQDDHLHSLFTDYSQQLLMQSQGLFSISTTALFGPDIEEESQYSTPPATFLRALEATPETVARDIRNHAEGLWDRGSSQIEVLAPETPVADATVDSMKRRKLDTSMSPSELLRGFNDVMVPATELVSRNRATDRATPSRIPKHRHHHRLTEKMFSISNTSGATRTRIPEPLSLSLSTQRPPAVAPTGLGSRRSAVVLAPETPVVRSAMPRPLVLVKSNSNARNSFSDSNSNSN